MPSGNVETLKIEDISQEKRPRLFEMLSIAGGEAHILSKEVLSDEPGDEKLLVLLSGENNLLLIEDTPNSEDSDEVYKAMLIEGVARDNLARILQPYAKARKESTGRPKVYHEDTAEALFEDNYKNNLSIKKISFRRNMSPTTVQKLLNEYRTLLAEKIANGEEIPILANDVETKLKVLEWAIPKSEGDKRRKYEQCYFKLSNM